MPLAIWILLAAALAFAAGLAAGVWAARRRAEHRLAQAAHEIRTPLTAIIGFSDTARARLFGSLPDRYAEQSELIHEAASHLLATAEAMLDAQALVSGPLKPRLDVIDAREAPQAAVRLMAARAGRAGIDLQMRLPDTPTPVVADRRMLTALLLNLIDNALKATAEGGAVRIDLQSGADGLALTVADTGGAHGPSGWGKGLALARAYARAHDGELTLSKGPGGATAVVRLPVQPARA